MSEEKFLPKALFAGQRFVYRKFSQTLPTIDVEYEVIVEYESGRLKWRKLYDFEQQINKGEEKCQ